MDALISNVHMIYLLTSGGNYFHILSCFSDLCHSYVLILFLCFWSALYAHYIIKLQLFCKQI